MLAVHAMQLSGAAEPNSAAAQSLKRKAEPTLGAQGDGECLTEQAPALSADHAAAKRLRPAPASIGDAALDAAIDELMNADEAEVAAPTAPAKPLPDAHTLPRADELPPTQPLPATQPAEEEAGQGSPGLPCQPVPIQAPTVAPTPGRAGPADSPSGHSRPVPSICFPSSSLAEPTPMASAYQQGNERFSQPPQLTSSTNAAEDADYRLDVVLPSKAAAPEVDSDTIRLAGYQMCTSGRGLGAGGLGTVRLAMHVESGRQVAIKIGNDFLPEEGHLDFGWWSFSTEWNVYAALSLGRGHAFCPDVFEMGLVRTSTGIAPWISMEVLGADLHTLNRRGHFTPANLQGYALGALRALQALHVQGFVHNDVKPANFCVRELESSSGTCDAMAAGTAGSGAAGATVSLGQQKLPQIVLVDYGFTAVWSPETAGGRWSFVGTPDFASAASLGGTKPGPRDDIEALGYSLLELTLGELPWDVTKKPSQEGKGTGTSTGWTCAQLQQMAEAREATWQALVSDGTIPCWLLDWVTAARALTVAQLPDYSFFEGLLEQQAAETRAAAAGNAAAPAAKAAEQPAAAHLMCAEE